MSIRKLVREYPEIFPKEKYQDHIDHLNNLDVGDAGVSMEYYIEEIIGIDGYTYDDHIGSHKITAEEKRKLIELDKKEKREYSNLKDDRDYQKRFGKKYNLIGDLLDRGWIEI